MHTSDERCGRAEHLQQSVRQQRDVHVTTTIVCTCPSVNIRNESNFSTIDVTCLNEYMLIPVLQGEHKRSECVAGLGEVDVALTVKQDLMIRQGCTE